MADAASPKKRGRPAKSKDAPAAAPAAEPKEEPKKAEKRAAAPAPAADSGDSAVKRGRGRPKGSGKKAGAPAAAAKPKVLSSNLHEMNTIIQINNCFISLFRPPLVAVVVAQRRGKPKKTNQPKTSLLKMANPRKSCGSPIITLWRCVSVQKKLWDEKLTQFFKISNATHPFFIRAIFFLFFFHSDLSRSFFL